MTKFVIRTELEQKVEELEEKILYLSQVIQFHGLDKIHIKYRKAQPKKNESLFFSTSTLNFPIFNCFTPLVDFELKIPNEILPEFLKQCRQSVSNLNLYQTPGTYQAIRFQERKSEAERNSREIEEEMARSAKMKENP